LKKSLFMAKATLAGGCFWCTDTLFARLEGVLEVISGYTDGHIKNPAYREVCTGRTGHAECIQLEYNQELISFTTLLEVFFDTHDPTTLNRQGADVGTQYRSGIYYHDERQKAQAEAFVDTLTKEKTFDNPIVTEIKAFKAFYSAEVEHKDYYNLNSNQPYCAAVISPKVQKLLRKHAAKLKST
jgi:peptide-methionine (S)-S-oxide reductase